MFLIADPVADVCLSAGYRGKPGEEFFSPFGTKIEMTGLGTPGADLSRQFDVDRYLLDGCRDVVAIEIADEAVRPDPDVATGLRCVEQLRPGVEKLHEGAAVRQVDVDGSGRIEARSGLRMMPTFPRSPLSFRTAGFPQYGWKAGISDGAFPVATRA